MMPKTRNPKPAKRSAPKDFAEPDSLIRRVHSLERQTEYRIDECHANLQSALREHLLDRVLANKRVSSNTQWAYAWKRASEALNGRHPSELRAQDWKAIIHTWLTKTPNLAGKPGLKRRTVAGMTIHIKASLSRFYPDGKVPEDIRAALRVTKGKIVQTGRVISDAEFNALLEAAIHERSSIKHPHLASYKTALLWGLWDSAMRPSEFLGLNVGDIQRNGDITTLALRPDAPLLKKGPRSVDTLELSRPLAVWLEQHPARDNPAAPLWPLIYDETGLRRMYAAGLDAMLKRWSKAAGLNKPGYKAIGAYDFRHTRLTRLARANWHPSKIEAVAGWEAGSEMTAHYVHIAAKDIRDQLLRDAGLDEQGYRQLMESGNEAAALAELLQRILAKTKGQGLSTSAPARI